MALSSWAKNFPEDPADDPGKFFHRVSIFALSTYCQIRKLIPPENFMFRNIEGKLFYIFFPAKIMINFLGVQIPVFNKSNKLGNVFWCALVDTASAFHDKKVSLYMKNILKFIFKIQHIQFTVYGNAKLIESFKMTYDYDIVKSVHTPSTTNSTTDISEADPVNKVQNHIKEAFFNEFDNLYKLCDGLPKILKKDFPLSFRFFVNVEMGLFLES